MSSPDKNDAGKHLILGSMLMGLAVAVIPQVFGERIEVSPFMLFAIVVVSNLAQLVVPEPAMKTAQTSVRLFYARLAVSALFSILLVVIYRVANTIA